MAVVPNRGVGAARAGSAHGMSAFTLGFFSLAASASMMPARSPGAGSRHANANCGEVNG